LWFWSQVSASSGESRAGSYSFGLLVRFPDRTRLFVRGVLEIAVNLVPSVFVAQSADGLRQVRGERPERTRRLAVPEPVLEAVEAAPRRVVHATGQPVRQPVDLRIGVAERAVGRTELQVREVCRQPVAPGPCEVAVRDVRVKSLHAREQVWELTFDVTLVCRGRADQVGLADRNHCRGITGRRAAQGDHRAGDRALVLHRAAERIPPGAEIGVQVGRRARAEHVDLGVDGPGPRIEQVDVAGTGVGVVQDEDLLPGRAGAPALSAGADRHLDRDAGRARCGTRTGATRERREHRRRDAQPPPAWSHPATI
jgi:hypothetical protein